MRRPNDSASNSGAEYKVGDSIPIRVGSITIDKDWNVREHKESEPLKAKELDESHGKEIEPEYTDEQLEASIRKRIEEGKPPLIQNPGIRWIDNHWDTVWGFRRLTMCNRIDPEMVVVCTVAPASEYLARRDNLIENLQRRNLSPAEKAEGFYRMKLAAEKEGRRIKPVEIADDTGLSRKYVANLLRIREKAHPELMTLFRLQPGTVRFTDLLDVITLPQGEQVAEYTKRLRERKERGGGRQPPQRIDTSGNEGSEHDKRPTTHMLRTYLEEVDKVGMSADYRAGMRYALKIALGEEKWHS